jgi:hypothetical protein
MTRENLIPWVLTLYLAACALPAIHMPREGAGEFKIPAEDVFGFKALVWGWTTLFLVPAWLTNPLLLAGLIGYGCRRYIVALIMGITASLTALSIWFLPGRGPLLIGYYLWQASGFVLTLAAYRAWRFVGPAVLAEPGRE